MTNVPELDQFTDRVLAYGAENHKEVDVNGTIWFTLPEPIRATVTIEHGPTESQHEEPSADAPPASDSVETPETSDRRLERPSDSP